MQKVIRSLFLVLLTFYLVVCGVMYFTQNKLLYFPQVENQDYSQRFKAYETHFQFDSAELHGWLNVYDVSESKPLLIYYGGNGGEASRNIEQLQALGFQNFVAINYRGYGRSSGEPNEQNLKQDALMIYDRLVNNYKISPQHIVLMGQSLGSGVATYVASEREVKKVILITPYDSLVEVAESHYPWLPVSLLLNQRFESNILASQINTPVLCLIAEFDQVIPPSHAEKLCSQWKGTAKVVTVPKATHNNIFAYAESQDAIKAYLQ